MLKASANAEAFLCGPEMLSFMNRQGTMPLARHTKGISLYISFVSPSSIILGLS